MKSNEPTKTKTMMIRMRLKLLTMAALVCAIVSGGCAAGDDSIAETPKQPAQTDDVVTLTTTVGLEGSAAARALTSGGEEGGATTRALNSEGKKTFAEGDRMAVIYTNTSGETVKAVSKELTAGDITTTGIPATDNKTASFTVTLTNPDNTKPIRYIYPAAMAKADIATDATIGDAGTVDFTNLTAQDGTLATLGSSYDLCVLDADSWTSGALPSGTLSNQLAILAVTVKDDKATATTEDDDLITASVTRLTVSDGTNKYTATGRDDDGHIYLAVLPTTDADITVDIYTAAHHYVKALADKKTYAASNLYPLGWKINQKAEPLTMEATTTGTIVVNNPRPGMQYSKNGGEKAAVTSDAISVSAGDKVEFYGDGQSITSYEGTTIAGGTAEVKVYGNIMSLLDEAGFAANTTLSPADNTFYELFNGNTTLTDASGLLLPATTLADYCYLSMFADCSSLETAPALPATKLAGGCYYSMFFGCSNLTAAPALPATELAGSCYAGMFADCTSLKTAPALPATKLADYCYNEMFSGCSSLETAPALPATELAEYCYKKMFYNCSNLTTAPALPATKLAEYCYNEMFSGCSSLETAPALPATELAYFCYKEMFSGCFSLETAPALPAKTLKDYCYESMFANCSNLTAAPALPATTLKDYCYLSMFSGCTNLSAVTCLATDISASNCTSDWLREAGIGVFDTKTFYKAASMNDWPSDDSGIPDDWTVVDYVAP